MRHAARPCEGGLVVNVCAPSICVSCRQGPAACLHELAPGGWEAWGRAETKHRTARKRRSEQSVEYTPTAHAPIAVQVHNRERPEASVRCLPVTKTPQAPLAPRARRSARPQLKNLYYVMMNDVCACDDLRTPEAEHAVAEHAGACSLLRPPHIFRSRVRRKNRRATAYATPRPTWRRERPGVRAVRFPKMYPNVYKYRLHQLHLLLQL